VVHDSEAAREYAECQVKARFLTAGRRPIELIETLRHDDEGFARLASHFERMAASARVFGLRFDEGLARQALQAAVAGKAGPLRVRLALDEAGQFQTVAVSLPPNPSQWTYAISPERIYSGDELLRHKISWRELYEGEVARLKTDEVLFLNERGELAEGARSNVFVRRQGVLLTPPLTAGLLPGRLREELLASGEAVEVTLTEADLQGEVLFGNSLRGLVPGVRAGA
jgi:para-aminobenzoate synthetase/4-amino-4-deoxychorismate lyase